MAFDGDNNDVSGGDGKDEEKMNGQEYVKTQMLLLEMGKIADSLNLKAFLKCISNAEAVAPMLDPTMYMKAHANLQAVKKLAEVAKLVQKAYGETYKAVMDTMVKGGMKGLP